MKTQEGNKDGVMEKRDARQRTQRTQTKLIKTLRQATPWAIVCRNKESLTSSNLSGTETPSVGTVHCGNW
jgi:hypothetical protein